MLFESSRVRLRKMEKEIPIGIVSLINIDYKNRNAECIIDIGEKAMSQKV